MRRVIGLLAMMCVLAFAASASAAKPPLKIGLMTTFDAPTSVTFFAGWSGDKKSFYVQSNERDKQYFDLCRYDAGSLERALFYKNTGGFGQLVVSRDGRRVALVKARTNADNDISTPDTGAISPVMVRSSVVLPAPFRPVSAIRSGPRTMSSAWAP